MFRRNCKPDFLFIGDQNADVERDAHILKLRRGQLCSTLGRVAQFRIRYFLDGLDGCGLTAEDHYLGAGQYLNITDLLQSFHRDIYTVMQKGEIHAAGGAGECLGENISFAPRMGPVDTDFRIVIQFDIDDDHLDHHLLRGPVDLIDFGDYHLEFLGGIANNDGIRGGINRNLAVGRQEVGSDGFDAVSLQELQHHYLHVHVRNYFDDRLLCGCAFARSEHFRNFLLCLNNRSDHLERILLAYVFQSYFMAPVLSRARHNGEAKSDCRQQEHLCP